MTTIKLLMKFFKNLNYEDMVSVLPMKLNNKILTIANNIYEDERVPVKPLYLAYTPLTFSVPNSTLLFWTTFYIQYFKTF